MNQDTIDYRRAQLSRVDDAEVTRIKIAADDGRTHWLRVTPEEYAQIRAVLLHDS